MEDKKIQKAKTEIIKTLKEKDLSIKDCITALDGAKSAIQSISKEQPIKNLDFNIYLDFLTD